MALRAFCRTLNDYGIKRFHHLRHFAVSRLANKGVDIRRFPDLSGIVNIKTTMDVYGHLFGEVVEMDLD
jgi:integrase